MKVIANPNDTFAPRLAYGEYGKSIGLPYALNITIWLAILTTVISLFLLTTYGTQTMGLCLIPISLILTSFTMNAIRKEHPLYGIKTAYGLEAYQQWYRLPIEIRSKIYMDKDTIVRVEEAEEARTLLNHIEDLHIENNRRILAEARLDSTASEVLDSVKQALSEERELLIEVRSLEGSQPIGRYCD